MPHKYIRYRVNVKNDTNGKKNCRSANRIAIEVPNKENYRNNRKKKHYFMAESYIYHRLKCNYAKHEMNEISYRKESKSFNFESNNKIN